MKTEYKYVNDFISPPFQPDLEKKPFYKSFFIEEGYPLFGIISDYFEFITNVQGSTDFVQLIPDSFTIFAVDLNDMRPFLFTCTQSICKLKLASNTRYFCARFFPGLIGVYFNCSGNDCLNAPLFLENVTPPKEYYTLLNSLEKCNTFEQRTDVVDKFIARKHDQIKDFKNIIRYARDRIIVSSGTIDMETLSQQTMYSQRYLRKLFDDYMSFSPKELCEMIKFQKSFAIICNTELLLCDIAFMCGYYDHPQMNKAYLRLVNHSPTDLYQLLASDHIPFSNRFSPDRPTLLRLTELDHTLRTMQCECNVFTPIARRFETTA